MVVWVVPFFSPLWFTTNQAPITGGKKHLCTADQDTKMHPSVQLKVGGLHLGGDCRARELAMGPAVAEETVVHLAANERNLSGRDVAGWRRWVGICQDQLLSQERPRDQGRERTGRWLDKENWREATFVHPRRQEHHPQTSGISPPLEDPLTGCGHTQVPGTHLTPLGRHPLLSVFVFNVPTPNLSGELAQRRETRNLCPNTTSWKTKRLLTSDLLNY